MKLEDTKNVGVPNAHGFCISQTPPQCLMLPVFGKLFVRSSGKQPGRGDKKGWTKIHAVESGDGLEKR